MYDLFDETKRVTAYDPNATHTFDKTPLYTFYTRRILAANTGRVFFYFDQAFGNLKWIRFEASNELLRVQNGMVKQTYTDEDFKVPCLARQTPVALASPMSWG